MKENKNRVKWGFIWAILCAITWGLGYIPMTVVWGVGPIGDNLAGYFDGSSSYLIAGVIIAGFQAIMCAVVLLIVWSATNGKFKESIKTFTHVKISKWLLLASLFGGPCAVYGSTLAIGYIGPSFAAGMGLLSAITGVVIGRIFFKERISQKTILGIILLLVGGIIILNPADMLDNIKNSADGAIYGYIGCLMSIIGWGVEGAFAAKAIDITDADSSQPVRYMWESVVWICILFPVIGVIAGPSDFFGALFDCITNTSFVFWTIMAALTLGMCYACMYKCYPLIGVGRTLSMTALYVPLQIVFILVFMGIMPTYLLVVGTVTCVAGMFVMYWESGSISESLRNNGGE